MQEFICTDETLDIYSTLQYRLSIQMSLDGFSFSILDTIQNKFVLLQHRPFYLKWPAQLQQELNQIITDNSILTKAFKSILISISTPLATLVPNEFFQPENKDLLFYQNFPYKEKHKLYHCESKEANCTTIYAVPEIMNDFIKHHFSQAKVLHHSKALFHFGFNNFKPQTSVFAFAHKKHIELFVKTGECLTFYNHFGYKTDSDIIYFILSVYKQLNLSQEQNELILGGFLKKQSELYQQLKRYISKIDFLNIDTNYTYSYTLNKIPKHYFSTLINLPECEL